jgi:hypothetical protein
VGAGAIGDAKFFFIYLEPIPEPHKDDEASQHFILMAHSHKPVGIVCFNPLTDRTMGFFSFSWAKTPAAAFFLRWNSVFNLAGVKSVYS